MTDNITIEKISHENRGQWDLFVAASPQGSLFNTFNWADILEPTLGLNCEAIAATKNGSILAGILFFYKSKYGLKVITRVPLSSYTGIVFGEKAEGEKGQKTTAQQIEIAELLLETLEREYKFINISSSHNCSDYRPFLWRQWGTKPQYTYILKLDNKEEIWNGFSSSLRRKIKRCETTEFQITQNRDINKLLELQEESYSKNGIKPVLPIASFEKIINASIEKDLTDIYSISLDGDIHSMRAVLRWNNIIYDWVAGTSAIHRNSNATHYLVWELLKKYSGMNFESFDFMGANTKNIIDFKRSFGGSLEEYFDLTYHSSPAIKLLFKIDAIRKHSSRKQD